MSDLISRQALCEYALNQKDKSVTPNDIMRFPSAQPETHDKRTETHVCDLIDRQAVYNVLDKMPVRGFKKDGETIDGLISLSQVNSAIINLPSAQPEWNNHTVACMLAELFDDDCACNYNGIDEWLPRKCELLDACPNPVGVACWEQYLKHRAERRTDE